MRRIVTALALLFCGLDLAAAISGYVIDENGKPLAGARVRAISMTTSEVTNVRLMSSAPEPEALATVQTNDQGAFRIDVKRQPVVNLLIDLPGYAPVSDFVVDGQDAGAFLLRSAPMKKGRIIAGGKPVAGATVIINSAFIARTDEAGQYSAPDPSAWAYSIAVLHPDFAIGTVSRTRDLPPRLDIALDKGSAVRGRVVDPAGRPIAKATVYGGQWPLATSGEDGSFSIAHVSPRVKSLAGREGTRIGTAKRGAETIVLRPGATVIGTVRSMKDDSPIAGMRVSVRGDGALPFGPNAITDSRGSFMLEGIPAGNAQLILTHPAFDNVMSEVTSAEGTRIELALAATPVSRVAGMVVDEQKKAVSGALVATVGPAWRTYTAPDGSFSMRIPSRERAATIEVTKPSYVSARYGPVRVEPGESKSGIRIVLTRGTRFTIKLVDHDGIDIAGEPVTISRQSDVSTQRGFFGAIRCDVAAAYPGCRTDAEGRVTFDAGDVPYDVRAGGVTTIETQLRGQTFRAADSPLVIELERGAVIEGRVTWSDGAPLTIPANVLVGGDFRTSAPVIGGRFTIRNVRAGKVSLSVTASGFPMRGESVEVTAPSNEVVLKLPRYGSIEGRVVEREGQQPIKQFTVALEPRGRFRAAATRAFTADDGRFVFEDVAPGTLDVAVTSPGYVRATTTAVEVPEGKPVKVELSLERAGRVAGRVHSGGRPLAGATVIVDRESGGRGANVKETDANGEYLLDTLGAGSHELTVRKQGYVSRSITLNVEVGKEVRRDVELSRGRELHGRVIDAAGKPVPGVEVYPARAAGRGRFEYAPHVTTDAEGAFRVEGLSDDVYRISARKQGYAESTVEVDPATATTVTITLQHGGTLTGRVSGLPPAELPYVVATAMGRPPNVFTAHGTVDASGAFTISGVKDGDVQVSAQHTRGSRQRITSDVKVVAGTAPFVELDFNSGFAIRGRVTHRGAPVKGMVHFASSGRDNSGGSTTAEIRADGTYETRLAASGQHRVMVVLQNSSAGTIEAGKVDIRGDMTHDIDVSGASIRGRVVDAATRRPLGDARITLLSEERRMSTAARADSSGRFVIELAGEGKYVLHAYKNGFAGDPVEVVLSSTDVDVELMMTPAESVLVQLVDALTGKKVDGHVAVVDASGRTISVDSRPLTGDGGGGRLYWLKPGSYSLRMVTRGYEPKMVPLVVPGTPTVRIELEPVKRD